MPKVSDYNTVNFLIYMNRNYEMFVYKHTETIETIEYIKKLAFFLRNLTGK